MVTTRIVFIMLESAATLARLAALIRSHNTENALIRLANQSHLRAGIRGKAIGGGAGIARSFRDHVWLYSVQAVEFVRHALTGIAAESCMVFCAAVET